MDTSLSEQCLLEDKNKQTEANNVEEIKQKEDSDSWLSGDDALKSEKKDLRSKNNNIKGNVPLSNNIEEVKQKEDSASRSSGDDALKSEKKDLRTKNNNIKGNVPLSNNIEEVKQKEDSDSRSSGDDALKSEKKDLKSKNNNKENILLSKNTGEEKEKGDSDDSTPGDDALKSEKNDLRSNNFNKENLALSNKSVEEFMGKNTKIKEDDPSNVSGSNDESKIKKKASISHKKTSKNLHSSKKEIGRKKEIVDKNEITENLEHQTLTNLLSIIKKDKIAEFPLNRYQVTWLHVDINYKTIWHEKDRITDVLVAHKCINVFHFEDENERIKKKIKKFQVERNIHQALKKSRDTNFFVKTELYYKTRIGDANTIDSLHQITELGDCTLKELVNFRRSQTKSDNYYFGFEIFQIVGHLLKALEILEEQKIFHGDINPENIIYTIKEKNLRLNGFGMSRQIKVQFFKIDKFLNSGKLPYMAPELNGYHKINRNKNYIPFKSDLYSLGITIIFCFFGDVYNINEKIDKIPNEKLKEMIMSMIDSDWEKRPTAKDLLEKYSLRGNKFYLDETMFLDKCEKKRRSELTSRIIFPQHMEFLEILKEAKSIPLKSIGKYTDIKLSK